MNELNRRSRVLAVVGDPNDINCWSNIPYFFLQAGKRGGFIDNGLPLVPNRQTVQKLIWNLASPLRMERPGGFQYTRHANEALLNQVDTSEIKEIISFFQLFPPYEQCQKQGISFSHYIDFPLSCLFEDYNITQIIGARTAQSALDREKAQYAAAQHIICMSPWAARQIVERCGVPSSKVHSIIPGANLPESAFQTEELPPSLDIPDGKRIPLRIAFVGKVPLRKGLDRLVEAVRLLRQRGYKTIVRTIGPSENLFPHDPEIEHLGFINKLHEPLRLIQELRSCHLGALLSYQEAFGIAALEYLRCGLPAIVTNAGGLGDSIPPDCGITLSATCTGVDIADVLEDLLKDGDRFHQLQQNARQKASYASWDRVIQDFQNLWSKQP
jgi:glycosyltransferase involved in cell wall biosynthesis